MSFYQDFIDHVERETLTSYRAYKAGAGLQLGVGSIVAPDTMEDHLRTLSPFFTIAQRMRDAKVVRLSGKQSAVFLETTPAQGQDYMQWLHLPFPHVYIQLDQAIPFHGYGADLREGHGEALHIAIRDAPTHEERERLLTLKMVGDPLIKGVLLVEAQRVDNKFVVGDGQTINDEGLIGKGWPGTLDVQRQFYAVFFMPIPDFLMNMHAMVVGITSDNRMEVLIKASESTRQRMLDWTVNTINFLSSPTIKLVASGPTRELQKARAAKGKPPLPGWYEIVWRHQVKDYGRDNKISGQHWHVSYRFDVRAHQRTYTKGPMAGRVVWVKSHQRGLKHELYKPATRRIEGEP